MAVFTWVPDVGITREVQPVVLSAKFGEGYEQRITYGARDLQKFIVTFSGRDNTETDAIINFLAVCRGAESFTWTPPIGGAPAGKYLCRSWNRTMPNNGFNVIGPLTFEEVADL
jgi:phage-related protein